MNQAVARRRVAIVSIAGEAGDGALAPAQANAVLLGSRQGWQESPRAGHGQRGRAPRLVGVLPSHFRTLWLDRRRRRRRKPREEVARRSLRGAPADTVDLKILEDSVHLAAPARDVEYVASLALGWPVKPDKAEAIYEHGLLRIRVPFKDPMEDAVKAVIKQVAWEPRQGKWQAHDPLNF